MTEALFGSHSALKVAVHALHPLEAPPICGMKAKTHAFTVLLFVSLVQIFYGFCQLYGKKKSSLNVLQKIEQIILMYRKLLREDTN